MSVKKVFYYTNQFYAGIGSEESASMGLEFHDGPIGPGALLEKELGKDYKVVKTAVCGDNTIAEKGDILVPQIVDAVRESGAELFVAGPAFNAGRYGLGCGYTTSAVTEQLKIPAVTAMFSENPGTDLYKNRCYILQSDNNARHLKDVVCHMADFAKRLCDGDEILDGKLERYHGSGPAIDIDYSIPAPKRGIDMLLAKINNLKFRTEVIMPNHEEIPVPQLTKPLAQCKIGLVTDGGLVPLGNPDKQVPTNSKFFRRYSIEGMDTLKAEDWEVSHQGYNSAFVRQDPNRLVPVDAMRQLVKEGVIGSLNEVFYSTAAVMTPMEKCKEFGEGIAKALIADGCDAVIETSTWGTSSRGGSVITKEIQRAGLPVIQVTNLTKIAEGIGANRILKGNSVLHVFGDPSLPPQSEKTYRQKHVEKALDLLEQMPDEGQRSIIVE